MPLVSIILPTYNVEKYIARALDSCINQTLKDIEIIVVDDKGQDKSIEIAKEYASRDNRIKIIDNIENKGTYEARNIGVRNASSEFIMFLDPDDELEIDACEIIYKYTIENVDMVFFGLKFIIENKEEMVDDYVNMVLSNKEYLRQFAKFRWNVCGKLFKKTHYINCILNVNVTKKLLIAEDALVIYFIAQNIKNNIFICSENLYKYHQNVSSITNLKNKDEVVSINNAYDNVIEVIKNSECENQAFKNYYIHRLEDEKYSFLRNLSKGSIFWYIYFKIKSICHRRYMKKYLKLLKG